MDDHAESGPLKFPPSLVPPSKDAARARLKLRGHSTSDLWLAEGLSPELDSARIEHLRIRGQVAAALDELAALDARFGGEDAGYKQELRQAVRDGNGETVKDERTPLDQRQADRDAILERYWAAVIVLGEVVDKVVALFREREPEWLGGLRSQLGPAQEKRREMQRLEAEARVEEWRLHRLGQYVQITAEAGPFGFQPAPTPEPPPKHFSAEAARSMLERPWHRPLPDAGDEPVRSWQDSAPAEDAEDADEAAEPTSGGDPTGRVEPLDETAGKAAA